MGQIEPNLEKGLPPHLTRQYHAPWYLRYAGSAHWQTIVPALIGRHLNQASSYEFFRERLELPDGDFIDLDWAGERHQPLAVLLLFHGLEGSSKSYYIDLMTQSALSEGWLVCAMNARGCSGENNRLLRHYYAGDVTDVEHIVTHVSLKARECRVPLFSVGVSLGGNNLLCYLGSKPDSAKQHLTAAMSICAPLDLSASGFALGKKSNFVYNHMFVSSLKAKVLPKLSRFEHTLDVERIAQAKTLQAFDDAFTAPVNGFANVQAYWQQQSSQLVWQNITVPTLILNSANDPMVPINSILPLVSKHDWVLWSIQAQGGHVGYLERARRFWLQDAVIEYFKRFLRNIHG